MLFTCPSCGAGHSVPASMIPSGGFDLLCRRCGESFRVDLPSGLPMSDENTAESSGERTRGAPEWAEAPRSGGGARGSSGETSESFRARGLSVIPISADEISSSSAGASTRGVTNPLGLLDEAAPPPREAPARSRPPEPVAPASVPPPLRSRAPAPAATFASEVPAAKSRRPARAEGSPPSPERPAPSERPGARDPTRAGPSRSSPPRARPAVEARSEPPRRRGSGAPGEEDATVRLDAEDLPSERPVDRGRVPRTLPPPLPEGTPSSQERGDLYERVAAGVYDPEEDSAAAAVSAPGEPPVILGAKKAWNEPSAPVVRAHPPAYLQPARMVAETLNRLPLPLQIGLVVFPIALGVVLFATSGRSPWEEGPRPLELPAPLAIEEPREPAAEPPAEPTAEPTAEPPADRRALELTAGALSGGTGGSPGERAAEGGAPGRAPRGGEPGGAPEDAPARRVLDDAPAGTGYAYVQVDRARLRTHAREDAELLAKLELGQLVKTYSIDGEWALVVAVPRDTLGGEAAGPAGFISERLLGPRKPVGALARQLAFSGCDLDGGRLRDDCLYDAKDQHDACLESCGPTIVLGGGAGPRAEAAMRCAEACNVAFADCQRACTETEAERRARAGQRRRR